MVGVGGRLLLLLLQQLCVIGGVYVLVSLRERVVGPRKRCDIVAVTRL